MFCLLLLCCLCQICANQSLAQQTDSTTNLSSEYSLKDQVKDQTQQSEWSCEQLDFCSDKLGFEAIRWLHSQLDDDANGDVDIAESDEFLRGELQYENGYERQKAFHGNDKHITVDELWKSWKSSEVRNWTIEETVEWLCNSVELPQYVEQFQTNAVDGMALPRLAANTQFLSILGINNPIHKQKIALKAMDVVLFGAPKHHNYVKDVLLVFSLVIAIGGCWFAYVQHKYSQSHLKKMMRDMDSLQRAEEQLMGLQQELDKTRQEQQNVVKEKVNLEKRLKENESQIERSASYTGLTDVSRLCELEEELSQTREELRRAENALASRTWIPPQRLQQWLQLTHELEIKSYNAKKGAAELQLLAAKEGCDKLRKKRSTLLGAFRVAHGNSIDDVDNRILQAKASLSEVTKDLKERLQRWRQIESYCGFPIVHNPGLSYLESVLYGSPVNGNSGSVPGLGLSRAGSEGTIVDDDGMPFSTALPSNPSSSMNDSSELANYGRGSVANFSIAGVPLRSSQDKSSMSLNLNNASTLTSQKQSSLVSPSSTINSSIYSSSLAPEITTDDEFDEDLISESSNRINLNLGNISSSKDSQKADINSVNSMNSNSKSRSKMIKSNSQDQESSNKNIKEDQNDNNICNSESCSELHSSTSSTVLNTSVSSPQQRTTSDINKNENLLSNMSQLQKSFDEETASTDSNSTDNKSITGKKRSFFGLRKRKSSKLS